MGFTDTHLDHTVILLLLIFASESIVLIHKENILPSQQNLQIYGVIQI